MANIRPVTRKVFTTATDITLHKKFVALSKKTRVPRARLIDEALELLFAHYEQIEEKLKK